MLAIWKLTKTEERDVRGKMEHEPGGTARAATQSSENGARARLHRRIAALWTVVVASLAIAAFAPAVASADFGITPGTFSADARADSSGTSYTQAGGHPYAANSAFDLNWHLESNGWWGTYAPDGDTKNIVVDLPPGFLGDPTATPQCDSNMKIVNSAQQSYQLCPLASQVGTVTVEFPFLFGPGKMKFVEPVFNVPPVDDNVATFAFSVIGVIVNVNAKLRTGGDYGVRLTIPKISEQIRLLSSDFTLWGVPASPAHDAERGQICQQNPGYAMSCSGGGHPSSAPQVPFLTNMTECSGESPVTTIRMESWQEPGNWKTDSAAAPAVTGCDELVFEPTISAQPKSQRAGVPTGYEVKLKVPQTEGANQLATPHLRDVTVTLPEGVKVSPPAADGLNGCSDAQLAVNSPAEPSCPQSSTIGDVVVDTPVLPEKLHGKVYMAQPIPGQLLRIFLVIEGQGVLVKLVGDVDPDPVTGQLVTTFTDNPPLPFSEFAVSFKGGARAPLVNPTTCGVKTTTAAMASFAGHNVQPTDSFTINASRNGGPCEAQGFNPSFNAGTANPIAGSSSPFSLTAARTDGDQEFKSLRSIKLPEGLLGNVSSVALCPDAAADAGTCAPDSRIGHIQVAAGAGAQPLWVPQAGKTPTSVYLTGPYKGAPYGLSIVVPAQAGPFDLGNVVVRSALHVDERTAQITAGVDESRLIDTNGTLTQVLPGDLPRILEGIVLNQREIRVIIDRDGFMINGGGKADVASRFRAAECANLDFAPRFRAKILNKGRKSTVRSFHPRTRFAVVPRRGDANIGGARVALPSSTILDQSNIGTTCTRAQMSARDCPAKSVVGYARAWSPLLRKAVQGPVYLAANGGVRPLPDLAAVLDGEIRVVLQGEISTLRSRRKARLQNTFRVVPDAPVSRFVLTMRGGKNTGLLVNSTDLCRSRERGVAVFMGQNGMRHRLRLRIAARFKGCAKVRRRVAKRQRVRRSARKSVARSVGAGEVARRAALRSLGDRNAAR